MNVSLSGAGIAPVFCV